MTALENFYEAIEEGDIPAAVPITSVDGEGTGISCQRLKLYGPAHRLHPLFMSKNPNVRARAALIAIRYSISTTEKHLGDHVQVVTK